MQFSSGTPTSFVKDNDLIPQISEDEAHISFAKAISGFIDSKIGNQSNYLDQKVKDTSAILELILSGLRMEGSYHLKPPCFDYDLINKIRPICTHGSPWVETAQKIMDGLSGKMSFDMKVDDNFHRVYSVTPVHLPQINNQCNSLSPCTLDMVTVSDLNYETMDETDRGMYSNSAQEIRAKLLSRQHTYNNWGYPSTPFDIDSSSHCSDINQKAYDWALNLVPVDVKERF